MLNKQRKDRDARLFAALNGRSLTWSQIIDAAQISPSALSRRLSRHIKEGNITEGINQERQKVYTLSSGMMSRAELEAIKAKMLKGKAYIEALERAGLFSNGMKTNDIVDFLSVMFKDAESETLRQMAREKKLNHRMLSAFIVELYAPLFSYNPDIDVKLRVTQNPKVFKDAINTGIKNVDKALKQFSHS